MSALKISSFLLFVVLFAACSSENRPEYAEGKEEQLPKVDASQFRLFQNERCSGSVLKDMSINRVSGDVIFSADYLPKEYHIRVSEFPSSRFRKDSSFPKDSKKQLEWFAEWQGQKWRDHLQSPNLGSLHEMTSNGQSCYLQTIRGKEFGFPKEQVIYLRCYRMKESFVAITSWTIAENESEFQQLSQFMGMKFRRN